ncbi:peptidase inhibitor family I36 protein [Micromonospora sp. M12]
MNIRKGLAVLGAVLAMSTSILSVASPAAAAARDGICDSGEFCYYYNSNQAGSASDFTDSWTTTVRPNRPATTSRAPAAARACA